MSSSSVDVDQRTRTLPMWQLLILVVLVFAFFGHSAWLDIVNSNQSSHIQISDRITIKAQQLGQYAKGALAGDVGAFDALATDRGIVDNAIRSLSEGNDEFPPIPTELNPRLDSMKDAWKIINANVLVILGQREKIQELTTISDKFDREVPALRDRSDDVVKRLVSVGADRNQIYLAAQQVIRANRMLSSIGEVLKGGQQALVGSAELDDDANLFESVMNGMFNGSDDIAAVTDEQALEALGAAFNAFDSIQSDIASVVNAKELFEAQVEMDIEVDIERFVNNTEALRDQLLSEQSRPVIPSETVGYIIVGVLFLWLIGIFRTLSKNDRIRAVIAQDQNERNQQAILRLLDEMASLADGDLTVNATVSEDITGAIADSVNFAIEALRTLVKTINDASVGVASAAQEAQATAMHLAEASEHQATQITNASTAINEIAVSIDEVSKNSLESADVAQRSVLIAHNGAEVVRDTIKGMNNIRSQIQDTSKRIKRLGESSQEIGNIVELINDIAEQTNILALNAAIQAASSGESGRGFAVVADEVQQLAERASSATRQIESIVETIQTDTNEAVKSMEQTTTEVVGGARKAEDAGEALIEIETVSNDLAELIQNISEAARQQSVAATNISGTMNVIQEITTQTSAGTQQTAESIGNLVELATELRKSVEDFKLPDDELF